MALFGDRSPPLGGDSDDCDPSPIEADHAPAAVDEFSPRRRQVTGTQVTAAFLNGALFRDIGTLPLDRDPIAFLIDNGARRGGIPAYLFVFPSGLVCCGSPSLQLGAADNLPGMVPASPKLPTGVVMRHAPSIGISPVSPLVVII